MSLMDNLIAIDNCKEDIKSALKEKGGDTYMDDVAFSGYADKIRGLQLGSGGGGSTTPSADYIYSNGYRDGDEPNEIVNLVPYEITLDADSRCSFELTCPIEIRVSNYENCDIIFTVEIPEKYQIVGFDIKGLTGEYEPYPHGYKENPRHSEVIRDGVTYKSYVRSVADGEDYNSDDVATDTLDYRITIESK
jgi:hypothetical protein